MEQSRRSAKRKCEALKNDLYVELTNLTNDYRNLQNDIHNANEDFFLMCKSMSERQADFLTRALFLEEKYGEVIGMLDGKLKQGEGESTGENVVLPTPYADSFARFAEDSNYSLKGHGVLMDEEERKMSQLLKEYDEVFSENMKVFGERAKAIVVMRTNLAAKLTKFNTSAQQPGESD
ncbi:hypothetical protein DCAR_0205889 [Daucus carota subsp. sativus]|uniref:Uncharacterized protein n=1 Tax=Daucus carota subsp. sativus TaxID=79200 RepID=A0A161Y542_DAUCS|nr:hypothetical protein DCAR_0205889 [Daucus carota subsp. sativus]